MNFLSFPFKENFLDDRYIYQVSHIEMRDVGETIAHLKFLNSAVYDFHILYSSSAWKTILKQWKNIPFNGNHYHFPNNYFNCCITRTVPAGCSLSLFSIIPLFSLGGTRGEWPKDNVKQNVLLCKWKRTFQSTKHESKKWQQKMLLSH